MHVLCIWTLQYADTDASTIPRTRENGFSSAPDLHGELELSNKLRSNNRIPITCIAGSKGKTHDSQATYRVVARTGIGQKGPR